MNKFPLVFICLILSSVTLAAQENPFLNEIEGLQFSKQEKFKGLRFLSSTREDVLSVFGSDCAAECNYDESWNIAFRYIDNKTKGSKTEGRITLLYNARPEFYGKLQGVTLSPRKKYILPETAVFPKGLQCKSAAFPRESEIEACWDGTTLAYYFYSEDDPKGAFKKNELVLVRYEISHDNFMNILESEPANPQ